MLRLTNRRNCLYPDLEEANAVDPPVEIASKEFFQVLANLPEITADSNKLSEYVKVSQTWWNERKTVIKHLRELADQLETVHGNVLIADRVGTGIGIGGGVLVIGGLIAAPFTAGLSLGLSMFGTGASALGGLTSLGSNVTDMACNKMWLSKIRQELEQHKISSETLSDLIPGVAESLARLAKFRPTLERLAELSEESLENVMMSFLKIIPELLNGNTDPIYKMFDNIDPAIKRYLSGLSFDALGDNAVLLRNAAKILTFVKDNISSIKRCINAYAVVRNDANLAKLAMDLSRMSSKAQKSSNIAEIVQTRVRSTFKGTPLAMSRNVRAAAGAATALFLAADIYYMVRICQETAETPTVKTLREMADQLEQRSLQDAITFN